MEELFKELVWKAYQGGCSVDVYDHGTIRINYFHYDENEVFQVKEVSYGNINGCALKRMHQEVDEFIEIEDTEFKTDNLTSYERNMKLAGHKESDFS